MRVTVLTYIAQLILSAGLCLLLVFIILSGAINQAPIDTFYWVQADTSNISGAPAISRWTFWGLAEDSDGKSKHVNLSPAFPISPVDNFNTTENVPQDFIDNRDTYYYLSRVAFGLYFVALAAAAVSFCAAIFVLCSHSVIKVNSVLVLVASITGLAATAMYTAVAVKAKNAFSSAGLFAKLGPGMFGIAWASTAILILLLFLSFAELCLSSFKKHRDQIKADQEARARYEEAVAKKEARDAERAQEAVTPNTAPYEQNQGTIPATESSGIKFFKIKRSQKDYSESD